MSHRFRGSVMVAAAQGGSGLGSIEVRSDGVTMRTALRRQIELKRSGIRRVEARPIRGPFRWATNFYFVGGDNKRARHYFVAYRTKALRASFEAFGYEIADV